MMKKFYLISEFRINLKLLEKVKTCILINLCIYVINKIITKITIEVLAV